MPHRRSSLLFGLALLGAEMIGRLPGLALEAAEDGKTIVV